jgi:hypothetical protein
MITAKDQQVEADIPEFESISFKANLNPAKMLPRSGVLFSSHNNSSLNLWALAFIH